MDFFLSFLAEVGEVEEKVLELLSSAGGSTFWVREVRKVCRSGDTR
jgi:hypothetical protein